MQIFDSLQAFRQQYSRCVATIGKYDGMHLGHQEILQQLQSEGRARGLPTLVVLSEPHPEEYFAGEQAPPRLQQFQDKVDYLAAIGIDAVFCLRFDEAMSRTQAQDFIRDILVEGLAVKSLVVGDDFNFGQGRQGNVALLRAYGEKFDFAVHEVSARVVEGERVSSTLVRHYLAAGRCDRVQVLLGRPYSMSGRVQQGRQLGRELGFPTANLALEGARPPMTGVFAVMVDAGSAGQDLPGVANVGYRPTLAEGQQALLEVHLFDFDGDLYGQGLRIHFLQRLRDEEKFPDLETLRRQIALDAEAARAFFQSSGEQQASS